MKALLDMPVSRMLLEVLERFGYSGVHASEIGRSRAVDSHAISAGLSRNISSPFSPLRSEFPHCSAIG